MRDRIAALLAALLTIAALVFSDRNLAQPRDPDDPFQYPELTSTRQFQRWWWDFEQRAFPLGYIPDGARLRALQEIELSGGALSAESQPVPGTMWVNIGPSPILGNTNWSGRVADVAVDPANTDRWLIGAAGGGVWETLDAGTSWTRKTDAQESLAMGAIAFAPSNPSIIYAGTGEAVQTGDAYAGLGLLKSVDGGLSWQLLGNAAFKQRAFSDIRVDPTNPNIVVAATTWTFTGIGFLLPPASAPPTGILKSTDGGVAWTLKLNGPTSDLEADPTNFNNQYAGVGSYYPGLSSGLYRSTNAGETWTVVAGPWNGLTGGIGRVELALAPSNPNVLYVSIADVNGSGGFDNGLLGLWRTDDAWASTPSWTQIPTGATDDGTGLYGYCGLAPNQRQCWYDHEIIVDPADPNTLYAGGIHLWKLSGSTWSDVLGGIHVDQHTMAWAGNRLIVGNDGGVYSTTSGGGTWFDHNTNLSITQYYHGSVHPTNPNFALGGAQDNGTQKWTGADAWHGVLGGDGADNEIASGNPDVRWAASWQRLQIFRTLNGGSFVGATSGIDYIPITGVPFIGRFEKCPQNDDVFIAGTDNLWKSTNFFSAGTPFWASNGPEMSQPITAVAFAPSDGSCNTYAFGTRNGQLRLTTTGGASWTDIDALNAVPDRFVTDLAFHPTNASVLYVSLSGFNEGTPQPGHLFRSLDALSAGPTWSNVGPPNNLPHNTISLDPFDPGIIYVGTDIGIWKSANGGGSWTHMGPEVGMPKVAVYDLAINHTTSRLLAFTHGRGVFSLTAGGNISGQVLYYRDSLTATEPSTKVVPDAVLNLTGTGPGAPDSTLTNAGGAYTFLDKPLGQNYTVTPKKLGSCQPVTPPPLVVSNLDAALNAQDVVGLTTLTPKQLLAADVSGNGTNSGYDSALIAQCAAGLISSFPVATTLGSDWFMVPVPASVPNQTLVAPNPATGVQGEIQFTPLVTAAAGQNFLGGLFGDVSGNWPSQGTEAVLPYPGTSASVESAALVDLASRLVMPKLVAAPGETVRVGIRAEGVERAVAFDLELRFDPAVLRLVGTEAGPAAPGFTLTSNPRESGRVRFGLFNAVPLGSDGEIAVVAFQVIGKTPSRSALQLGGTVDEGRIPVSIRQGSVRVSSKNGTR